MKIHDIYFENITSKNSSPGSFLCDSNSPCEKFNVLNVDIESSKSWKCQAVSGKVENVSPGLKDCFKNSDDSEKNIFY